MNFDENNICRIPKDMLHTLPAPGMIEDLGMTTLTFNIFVNSN
jgi:hypothetical protein